jgi:hypothetical protein
MACCGVLTWMHPPAGLCIVSADRFSYVKELHEANARGYFADRPDKLLVLDISEGDG